MPLKYTEKLLPNGNTLIAFKKPYQKITVAGLIVLAIGLAFKYIVYVNNILYNHTENLTIETILLASFLLLIGITILLSFLHVATAYLSIEIGNAIFAIKKGSIIYSKANAYNISEIVNISYIGYNKILPRANGETATDFYGIAEMDKGIQVLNYEGNIGFTYHKKLIQFGKDVPSWDAAPLLKL